VATFSLGVFVGRAALGVTDDVPLGVVVGFEFVDVLVVFVFVVGVGV